MADIKFSELPKATTSKDSDEIAILQDGVNKMIASPVLESKIINKTVSRVIEQGGASLNLINPIDTVPTYASLSSITPTPNINDAYQVEADGLVYVYTENGFQADGEGFKVQPDVNGIVEQGNTNAVSGNEVFEYVKPINYVLGISNTTKYYPIDFSTLTIGLGGQNYTYINETAKVTENSLLKDVRVKSAVGSEITISVYNIATNEFTGLYEFELLHTYDKFTLTSETQVASVNDSYIIPSGAYIAIKSSLGLYYKSSPGQGYNPIPYLGVKVDNTTSMDFYTTPLYSTGLISDIEKLKKDVSLESDVITELYSKIDNIIINTDEISSETENNTIELNTVRNQIDALLTKNPSALQLHTQIIVDGDSLDYGEGATDESHTWPSVLKSHLGTVDYGGYFNVAVSGQFTTHMLARQPIEVIAKYNNIDYQKNIVIVGGGINDLMQGVSPASVYETLKTYHRNAVNAGFQTIAMTHSVSKKEYGVGVAIGEANRLILDDMIRKGWVKDFGASALVDLGKDPRIGIFEDQDTSLYVSDLQHFNDAGYAYKESLIQPAVVSICKYAKHYGLVTLDTTSILSFSKKDSNTVKVSWSTTENATNYLVLRNTVNSLSGAVEVYNGSATLFNDSGNFDTQEYFYFLKPQGNPDYYADGVFVSKRYSNTIPSVATGNLRHFSADEGFDSIVGSWSDISGNGDIAVPESSTKPVLELNVINGLPSVKFNNSNLITNNNLGIVGNSPRSFLAVIKLSSTSNQSICGLGGGNYSTSSGNAGKIYDLINYLGKITGHTIGYTSESTESTIANTPILVGIRSDSSGTSVYFNDIETLNAPLNSINLVDSKFRIGGGHYVPTIGGLINGYISEIIVRNDSDVNKFNQNMEYLKYKYEL